MNHEWVNKTKSYRPIGLNCIVTIQYYHWIEWENNVATTIWKFAINKSLYSQFHQMFCADEFIFSVHLFRHIFNCNQKLKDKIVCSNKMKGKKLSVFIRVENIVFWSKPNINI